MTELNVTGFFARTITTLDIVSSQYRFGGDFLYDGHNKIEDGRLVYTKQDGIISLYLADNGLRHIITTTDFEDIKRICKSICPRSQGLNQRIIIPFPTL